LSRRINASRGCLTWARACRPLIIAVS
jgi:hypothetical protein